MAPRALADIPLINVLVEIRYTLSSLLTDPTTASLAPAFQSLRSEWKSVADQEVELLESLASAEANLAVAVAGLSDFSDRIAKAVLQITKGERGHPLYIGFFGSGGSNDLRGLETNPDREPESTQPWIASLQSAPYPALKAMAPELAQRHAQAALALKALRNAEEKHRYFTQLGARTQFLDKLNIARADVFSVVSRHAPSSAGVPGDYANRFFRDAATDRRSSAPPVTREPTTLDEVRARVSALKAEAATTEAELVQRTAQLKRLEDEAERHALEVELAELEKKDGGQAPKDGLRERLGRR